MGKLNYTEFDKALLTQIAAGRDTMMRLDSAESGLNKLAEPLRVKDRWGHLTPYFRVIDRRLQALRKRGEIRFDGKVWVKIK
jgi:hypothetical protein